MRHALLIATIAEEPPEDPLQLGRAEGGHGLGVLMADPLVREPAALLVIVEIAATFRPRKRARITSGTVDMPTASAPRMRIARISAGVSKEGPEYQA
jgi:hypothetical protein